MSYYGIQRNKPDDEICHFKYIDRYKKNGKWQYVYEESKNKVNNAKSALKTNLNNTKAVTKTAAKNALGGKKKTAYEEAMKNYEKAHKKSLDLNAKTLDAAVLEGQTKDNQNRSIKGEHSRDALIRKGSTSANGVKALTTEKAAQKRTETLHRNTEKLQSEMRKAYSDESKALKEKNDAKKAYKKSPLYKFEKASEKGKAIVDKLASKTKQHKVKRRS